jgi:hypothetical protein
MMVSMNRLTRQKRAEIRRPATFGHGPRSTWTAIDVDTKLIPSWLVGSRDAHAAHHFIGDLALRLANRVQLTRDGHKPYLQAVEESFGAEIDYAMLLKIYGNGPGTGRYSPGVCVGAEKRRVEGRPDALWKVGHFLRNRVSKLFEVLSKVSRNISATVARLLRSSLGIWSSSRLSACWIAAFAVSRG